MATAVDAFTAALIQALHHASSLAGATVKWKDADLILRHAQPEAVRVHTGAACRAAQKRDHPACRLACLPDEAWWKARSFVGHWRTCHAGLEEYVLPVRDGRAFLGTILIGTWAGGKNQPDRPRVEAVAAWTADSLRWLAERRQHACQGVRQVHGQHPTLQRAVALVLADPRRDQDLSEIAKAVGLSATRLTHLWRSETGQSFTAWRDAVIADRAKRLLAADDLSIGMIASACGYGDAAHFAAAFKRWTGQTPTAYRRALVRDRP
jgi:AraC-like DNA-binding protein